MLEIPEAVTISKQINSLFKSKRVMDVIVAFSPHKLAWYVDAGVAYKSLLLGQGVEQASPSGGMVDIKVGPCRLVFSDGVALRYRTTDEGAPKKHQLLLTFDDQSHLSASVQMYGGLICFHEEDGYDNFYYQVSHEKPSPLSEQFNEKYFDDLISAAEVQKLSLKAFLATEQRIPGLGNGVLQDILWTAKLNPRRKVNTLTGDEKSHLYSSVKSVLEEMTRLGGRNTEKDLFGQPGGYQTVMSKNNTGSYCPDCGGIIVKASYMGGSVYHCDKCQAER